MLLQIEDPTVRQPQKKAIGIDLGTTNTVVGYIKDGKVCIIPIDGNPLMPSVLSYDMGEFSVGTLTKDAVHSVKRFMHNPSKKIAFDKTVVELSAEILKKAKHEAEKALGEDITEAVITVPAYFDDTQRQATKDAAEIAGLKVLRLLNEPTAAALAYGLNQKSPDQSLYLVYDFGGGTFDVSLLKFSKGIFQVIGTFGDTHLGGDDIDLRIQTKLNLESPLKAREVKHQVPHPLLSGDDLKALTHDLIEITFKGCEAVLKDAGYEVQDLAGIILVGGSTRLYGLKESIMDRFGIQLYEQIDPDLSVAHGAALTAHALTQGSSTLLLDVTPLSLGIETMGGLAEKIIARNTPIPVRMAQDFTTYVDSQTMLKIHVVQGEREMAEDCRSLCEFTFKNIPAMPAGKAKIRITFALDADGILSVNAKELLTNQEQEVEVKPSYGLTEEQMRDILLDAHKNAKDDIEERLTSEAIIVALKFIDIVEQAVQIDKDLLSEAELTNIQRLIQEINHGIDHKDRGIIKKFKEDLTKATQTFAEKRLERAIRGSDGQNSFYKS